MASQYKAPPTRSRLGLAESEAEFKTNLANIIPQLRTLLRILSRSRDLAEDLTQEALAKAWRARGSFEPGTNFKAWIFTIARNEFYTSKRQAWRRVAVDPAFLELVPAAPDEQNWAAELSDMLRALGCLPETQRQAVLLVGAAGFSYEEAALISRIALGTLKSRVFRARQALRTLMDGDLIPPTNSRTGDKDAMTEVIAQVSRLSPISIPRILPKTGVQLRGTSATAVAA